jgi:tRNA U55 pseudouridine synthase TruB
MRVCIDVKTGRRVETEDPQGEGIAKPVYEPTARELLEALERKSVLVAADLGGGK